MCLHFLHVSLNSCCFKETKTINCRQNLNCGFIEKQWYKIPIKGLLLTEKALDLYQKIECIYFYILKFWREIRIIHTILNYSLTFSVNLDFFLINQAACITGQSSYRGLWDLKLDNVNKDYLDLAKKICSFVGYIYKIFSKNNALWKKS